MSNAEHGADAFDAERKSKGLRAFAQSRLTAGLGVIFALLFQRGGQRKRQLL